MNKRLTVLAIVGLALLAGCGGGGKKKAAATTTSAPPTTAPAPTVAPSGPVMPLTGLPADPAKAGRPALIVKIDNAPAARPQIGLNQADVVIEEKVEDGVTRFATIFQSSDSDPVGPVRSARSTDVHIVGALNHPLFAYSGANGAFLALVHQAPLVDVGVDSHPAAYHRDGKRKAPYNLFSSTGALYGLAPGGGPPPAQFTWRAPGAPPAGAGMAPNTKAHIEFQGQHITTRVDYAWDGTGWKRSQDGGPHVDASGAQVAPANVVVLTVNYVDTPYVDKSGTRVPEAQLIGQGDGWVLTGGQTIPIHWSRAGDTATFTLTDSAGAPVGLTPGKTWVELPPPGGASIS
jgi:hypothetical protein